MKIRIKFTKEESVKFLGHLDIMRSFQKCFNRANVKMNYSEGFNPHQKMTFALPLGVGITSRAEYLDAQVADGQDPDVIADSLNKHIGTGFKVLGVIALPENAPAAMAIVKYAAFTVKVPDAAALKTEEFLSQPSIPAVKTTKSGSKEIDLKKLIYKLDFNGDSFNMILSAGGEDNIKPELLMENLYAFSGVEFDRFSLIIERTELMTDGFTPLIA
ncbi:MAG: DUF2344 domain-containing protein [Parasporobacterium sp.]|nr:DUF2344 domain-containing protein [Parasporobacterium sp.]